MNEHRRQGPRVAPILNLFAKVPVAGQVKTRLIPRLGPQGAAQLARQFIFYTLDRTTCEWPGDRVLWLWPDIDEELATAVQRRFPVDIRQQVVGDLGVKMMAALQSDLESGLASAVMGCDLIHTPAAALALAGRQMIAGENTFGNTEDGGFWLLGLNQPAPTLFDGIDWRLPNSGQATLERAAGCNIQFGHRAPTMYDIDYPQDLDRLRLEHPQIVQQLLPE